MKLPEFRSQVLAHFKPILGDRLDEEGSTFTPEENPAAPRFPIYVVQLQVDGRALAPERFTCGPSGEQARLDRFLKLIGDRMSAPAKG